MSKKENHSEAETEKQLEPNELEVPIAEKQNTPDEITDPLTVIKEELQVEKDKFLRLFAEFENYKKRNTKERIELFKTAGQEVILSILPVLDDFDRALEQLSKLEVSEDILRGVQLIQEKLKSTLKSKGLEEIVLEKHTVFNTDIHEAITQIPASSEDMKGKIIDIVEKGYQLGDKVIRYPKVIVAN